jgi:hypothetical protein
MPKDLLQHLLVVLLLVPVAPQALLQELLLQMLLVFLIAGMWLGASIVHLSVLVVLSLLLALQCKALPTSLLATSSPPWAG